MTLIQHNNIITDTETGSQQNLDVLHGGTGVSVPGVKRSIDSSATGGGSGDPATDYLNTFTPPQTTAQIAEQMRQQSQGTIDSLNKVYDDQVGDARKAGDERLDQDNAVSVLS